MGLFPRELWTASGSGEGKEGGEEAAPRPGAWVSGIWYYLPEKGSFKAVLQAPPREQVLKTRGGALSLNGNWSWGGCHCLSGPPS